jgi:hypothetical protein
MHFLPSIKFSNEQNATRSAASNLVSETPSKAIKFSEELFYVHLYKNIESKFCNTTLLDLYNLFTS